MCLKKKSKNVFKKIDCVSSEWEEWVRFSSGRPVGHLAPVGGDAHHVARAARNQRYTRGPQAAAPKGHAGPSNHHTPACPAAGKGKTCTRL